MVPRRGSVSVTLRAVESVGDQLAHINELVNSYRSNKLPGDFKVEQANGMYYVVPVKTMSQNGAFRDVVSPLLVPVSFPYAERRLIGTVALILEGVSKSGGPRIDVGALPFNPAEAVAFSAKREPARDALARLFAKTTVKPVSCRLLFDPVFKYYMLNVQAQSESHSMAPPVENTPAVEPPTGARKLQPGENQWADRAQK
jgi:hypothetical protein